MRCCSTGEKLRSKNVYNVGRLNDEDLFKIQKINFGTFLMFPNL